MDFDDEDNIDLDIGEIKEAAQPGSVQVIIPEHVLENMTQAGAYQVVTRIESRITQEINKKLSDLVDEAIRKVVGDRAEALVIEELTKPRQKFNEWGTPIGPTISFNDQIPGVVESYLNTKVNEKGQVDNYSGDNKRTRAAWIIASFVKADIDPAINNAVSSITKQARDIVSQKVAAFVAEQMIPAIEFKRPA